MATRGLGVVSTLVLARILAPQDFGVVAIATTYIAAFDALSIFGLQDAIIRADRPGRALNDTSFTLSVVRGFVNGGLVALTAPLAAAFFDEPRLRLVLYILAALEGLEGFENIGIVEFRRELRFDKEFQLFLLPRLLAVAVTILCALQFHSYWALIAGISAQRITRFVFTYAMHPYRPRFGLSEWRQIAGFSFWTWASNLAAFGRDRSWTLVIGHFFDSASVGTFSMASEIGLLPVSEVIFPICRALFPGLALARQEGSEIGSAFARALGILALIVLPASVGISAIGSYIMDLALGAKWSGAIPIMQIIAASAPLMLLTAIGSTVLNASGHVRNNFWIVFLSAIGGILASALAAWLFGLLGVAVAVSLLTALEGLLFMVVTARTVGTRARELLSGLWRPLAATSIMTVALWFSSYGWSGTGPAPDVDAINCLTAIAIGAVSYVTSLFALHRLSNDPDSLELYLFDLLRKALRMRSDTDS